MHTGGIAAGDPRLVLRPARPDDFEEFAEAAIAGIHAAPDDLRRSLAQFHWRARADVKPNDWLLVLAVEHEGRLIGSQDVRVRDFAAGDR